MKKPPETTMRDERAVAGGRRMALTFQVPNGPVVPAILLAPTTPTRGAAALLLHGYGANKEQMADSMGEALLREGVASLAIDLPLHGERPERLDERATKNPLQIIARWKEGVAECATAFRYLAARPEADASKLGVVGYSMGSFLGVLTASADKEARAVVLAAGGDLPPNIPFQGFIRRVVDPLKAVKKLDGRPLLMIHGKRDRTVKPEQAERLFAAAGEPKEIRWYDCGHWLTDDAIHDAARWLATQLEGKVAMRKGRTG
jgi:predicted esterase